MSTTLFTRTHSCACSGLCTCAGAGCSLSLSSCCGLTTSSNAVTLTCGRGARCGRHDICTATAVN